MLQQGEQVLELFESDVVRRDVQPFQGVSSQADCAVVDDRSFRSLTKAISSLTTEKIQESRCFSSGNASDLESVAPI
jgi:hypothetical protein